MRKRRRRNTNGVTKAEMKNLQTLLEDGVNQYYQGKGFGVLAQAFSFLPLLEIKIDNFIGPEASYPVEYLAPLIQNNLMVAVSHADEAAFNIMRKDIEKLTKKWEKVFYQQLHKTVPWFSIPTFKKNLQDRIGMELWEWMIVEEGIDDVMEESMMQTLSQLAFPGGHRPETEIQDYIDPQQEIVLYEEEED